MLTPMLHWNSLKTVKYADIQRVYLETDIFSGIHQMWIPRWVLNYFLLCWYLNLFLNFFQVFLQHRGLYDSISRSPERLLMQHRGLLWEGLWGLNIHHPGLNHTDLWERSWINDYYHHWKAFWRGPWLRFIAVNITVVFRIGSLDITGFDGR